MTKYGETNVVVGKSNAGEGNVEGAVGLVVLLVGRALLVAEQRAVLIDTVAWVVV